MGKKMAVLVVVAALLCFSTVAWAQQALTQDDLGRTVKYKIFVDKVIGAGGQGGLGWGEQAVKETAEAGFNVFSPRIGGENMERVRQMTRWCEQYGVFHVPWMRGTLEAPAGPEADGKRVLWRSGAEQPLWSVNSDEFWQWTTDLIVQYAQISAEMPHLIGVFLDYENYAGGEQDSWMLYELMYDDIIMNKFAEARGITLPDLEPAARAPWLEEHGLHDAFSTFQINHWRERCRELREAVDAINPKFQFFMYPSVGSLFMQQAAYPNWSTKAAPIVITTPHNYGRPGIFMLHDEALEINRQIVQREIDIPRKLGIPFFYTGGIDPVVRGADPEFSARNAVMSAYEGDGYWVFYEGPVYTEPDHAQYMRWFSRANRAIDREQWGFQYRDRETPEPSTAKVEPKTDLPQVAVFDSRVIMSNMISDTGNFEVHDFISVDQDYINHFDVIILQNFNYEFPRSHPISIALRNYVEQGGGLMLAHDTAWFMESPFPEVAVRDYPKFSVEAVRHVVYTNLRVLKEHEAAGSLKVGTEFETEFYDHMIFKAGPQGTTIIENTFGDPVYVIGEVGKGRVAFLGSYYGYKNELEGAEREAFLSVLKWLAGTR